MNGWDTDAITSGEWWVLLIAAVALLVGVGLGYALGRDQARKEFASRGGYVGPATPPPPGGPLP